MHIVSYILLAVLVDGVNGKVVTVPQLNNTMYSYVRYPLTVNFTDLVTVTRL